MKQVSQSERTRALVAVARGDEPADMVLRGGQVVDVFTGEIRHADVAVKDGLVAGVGSYDRAVEVLDVAGQYVTPGFIEGHIHIESSMLAPPEFCRLVLAHGTTTVVADPHEIANVLGSRGVKYLLAATDGLPVEVFLMAPSCVPSTGLETAGAKITAADIKTMLGWDRVLGLAEMMNYPGVVFGDETVHDKLAAAEGRVMDGHAPALVDRWLQAYASARIGSDHESFGRDEAREKLRAGMRLMIREGSAARNLAGLLPVVTEFNQRRCCLVTDDKHADELLHEGHLDATLRKAVAQGVHPAAAIQMVTLNPAEHFGLAWRGAVAPGWVADLVVLNDLGQFRVRQVLKAGRLVVRDGTVLSRFRRSTDRSVLDTVDPGRLTLERFRIKARGETCRVIRLVPDQIVTEQRIAQPRVEDGYVEADPERDVLKLAVLERHRGSGRTGLGLVSGFGLRHGALGATVCHDSHNLIVVGTNDRDMLVAAKELKKMGGGYVAVARGKVGARLPLPIAGLMADDPADEVAAAMKQLLAKAHVWGCRLANPFISLSFLALPVIPELKLTDHGLVDVGQFKVVDLFSDIAR